METIANPIILKIYIRQSEVNPAIISSLQNFLNSNPIFLSTDVAFTQFKNEAGKDN
jgi:hypothetical protein